MSVVPRCLTAAVAATAIFTAIFTIDPSPARAGIQNVQSAQINHTPEGFSGNVTASADWRTGNISFLFLAASAAARHRTGKHLTIALVRLDRKTSGETVIISRTFEHLRHRYEINERLLVEGFLQHEFDGVKRVKIRALAGVGPRLTLVDEDRYKAGLGVAYMLEYEEIKDDVQADAGDTDLAHRLSSYLVASYELESRVQLVETFYAQPKLTDVGDIRLLNEASVVVKATEKISLTTAFNIAYDREPPLEVKRLDTALTTSISIDW